MAPIHSVIASPRGRQVKSTQSQGSTHRSGQAAATKERGPVAARKTQAGCETGSAYRWCCTAGSTLLPLPRELLKPPLLAPP